MHNREIASFPRYLLLPGSPESLLTLVTALHFLSSAPAGGELSAGGGVHIADQVTRQESK